MDRLAINGGSPVYSGAFPRWPQWGGKEEENLMKALDAGRWGTLGAFAVSFSKRFADYICVTHGIAVNSGTQALELILRGAGIGRGDEVIVSPYTFPATVSAIAYVGAMPVFSDVDWRTGNIDAEAAAKCVTFRTKAVIAVHVGGYPCDMDAMKMLAERYGLLLIEDCAHAHGSAWRGRMCGSIGDAGAFSFQKSMVLPCGEGGMITTSDENLFRRCWQFHHSGRVLDCRETIGNNTVMGTNGRMAEWEAAILDAQMDRLEPQCKHRQASIRTIVEGLSDLKNIILPPDDKRITALSGFHFQFIWNGAMERDDFVKALCAEGIPCFPGYVLLNRMGMMTDPAFEKMTGRKFENHVSLHAAESLAKRSVRIPNPVLLAEPEVIAKVVEGIRKVARA